MPRTILPNRRESVTFQVEHQYKLFTVTMSPIEGEAIEVFISGPKSGEALHALLRDAAIVSSLALQYGCPLSTLREAMSRGEDKSPHSIIGSVLDAL